MRVRVLGLAIIAATLVAAPRMHAQAAPSGYPEVGAPPVITLASAGAEPRRALRYAFVKGRQETLGMNMTMGMEMQMAGMAMPAMSLPAAHMAAALSIDDVSGSGDATVTSVIQGMTWDTAGADPNIVSALQAGTNDIKGLKYTVTVSNRGIMGKNDLDVSKLSNPQVAQVVGSMSSSLQSMSMPLPAEPIGVGAKWEVRQAMPTGGMRVFQKVQVELVSLTAQEATLKLTTSQTAPPQPVSNPALPPGVQATLDKLDGTGTGTMTIRFDSIVPRSEITSQTTTAMSVDVGGSAQQIAVAATMKVSLGPGK